MLRYKIAELTATAKATGGSISFYNGKTIHTFTSSGTFATTSDWSAATVEYVVIGGGGAGSSFGVEVPVLIEPVQHQSDHQYQQVLPLVPVAQLGNFHQAFQPMTIKVTTLISEHQSPHLEEVAVVMMAIMEVLVVLVAVDRV